MIKKILTGILIASATLALAGCGSKETKNLVPINQTSLAINIPQQAQPIPNLLVPSFTGVELLKAYKIMPDQSCSIQKTKFKDTTTDLPLAYLKTLESFFPGFKLEDLGNQKLQCDNQNYEIFLTTFAIPHTNKTYYFYQAIIPSHNKGELIIVSCQATQPSQDLAKIVYNINCLKNE